jgi:hypothetical protein
MTPHLAMADTCIYVAGADLVFAAAKQQELRQVLAFWWRFLQGSLRLIQWVACNNAVLD